MSFVSRSSKASDTGSVWLIVITLWDIHLATVNAWPPFWQFIPAAGFPTFSFITDFPVECNADPNGHEAGVRGQK